MAGRGLAILLLVVPAVAEGRPVSPHEGGVELGGAAFVGTERIGGERRVQAGPLLHVAWRSPVTPSIQLGLSGRFGLGGGGSATGATGAFGLEARYLLGGLDWCPYLLAGLGVIFQNTRDDRGANIVAPRPALPLGLGIDSRLGDTLMLGFAVRYTAQLSALGDTTGPIDLAIYLFFL